MAYVYNPYGDGTGLGSAISQAVGTFAKMRDDASTRALREAQIRDVQSEIQQRQHRQRMGDALATAYGAGAPVSEVLAASTRAGPDYLKLAGQSYLTGVANRPGSTNDERLAAFVGAGGAPSPDNAFTADRQDMVSARNAAEDYALGTAKSRIAAGPSYAGVALNREKWEAEQAAGPDPVTLSSGEILVNPRTGQPFGYGAGVDPETGAPRPEPGVPFTLGSKDIRYGPDGEPIARGAGIDPVTGAPRPDAGAGRSFGRLEEQALKEIVLRDVASGVDIPPDLFAQVLERARGLYTSGAVGTLEAAAQQATAETWQEAGAGWLDGPRRLEPVAPQGGGLGDAVTAAPQGGGGAPRPGDVVGDDEGGLWRFRGGDPGNSNNWEPVY